MPACTSTRDAAPCAAHAGRPFILLEVRHVSLRLCMRASGVDDVVRALAAVLQRHGIRRANFAGHSFGTLVIAHLRKIFPETVASVLLCDPVRRSSCACTRHVSVVPRPAALRLAAIPQAWHSVVLATHKFNAL
jgi:pimeloyl-ACP methyl ester carboxylesterase